MLRQIYFFLSFYILIQFSCKQKTEDNNTGLVRHLAKATNEKDIHSYQAPEIILLDTMPKPVYNLLSAKIKKTFLAKEDSNLVSENRTGAYDHFITYSTEQGLALSTILCGLSDQEGNLWFGTQGGGVSKYNGKKFTNYSTAQGLVNNTVLCICQDNQQNLWFGTDGGGMSMYDGISFKSITNQNGLASDIVRDVMQVKNGDLWFATFGGGITILNQSNKEKEAKSFHYLSRKDGLISDEIWCMCEDKNGNIWMGTDHDGVCKYDGKTFVQYTTSDGLAGDKVRYILNDKNNNLWLGTEDGGVSKYDQVSQSAGKIQFTNYSISKGLKGNSIKCILEDRKGHIWFSLAESGVCKLNDLNGQVSYSHFSTANGLTSNSVYCMIEDVSDNLWFGTYGGGVSNYCGDAFSNYNKAQGLPNSTVWGIEETKNGTLWLGTDGDGICRFNEYAEHNGFENLSVQQGLASDIILSVKKDQHENLWLGTLQNGVIKYDGKGFTNYTTKQGLAHDMVLCIKEDKQGNLWFGTGSGGVSKLSPSIDGKGASFTNYTNKQGLANDVVLCMTETKKGELWFGTQGGGLSRLKMGDTKSGESYFINYTATDGLANNVIVCITEDRKGDLYIGTENGLSVLSIEKDEKVKIKNYSTLQGLPDNYVTNVLQLPNGKIAIGTNNGIALFNSDLPLDKNGKLAALEIFNMSTGYPIKDVNGQGSMFLDSKGIMWAGTGYDKVGLVRFDYNAVKRNLKPPKVVIEKIKLNEQDICWYSLSNSFRNKDSKIDSSVTAQQEILCYGNNLNPKEKEVLNLKYAGIKLESILPFYPVPQHLVLPYKHNQITFEFNCIEVSRHNLVNYQYMLEGYDKEWSPVLKKTEATFGNMNEGDYTFKVKAQSPDGIWSEPVNYTFKVLPPWYRTWWAYLIYIIITISSVTWIFRWRIREIKLREEQLRQTVRERTAELVSEKKEVEKQKDEAEKQYQRSEELLLNILPEEIAEELKMKGEVAAKQFHGVTVMFTDFVNFTGISQTLSPQSLVSEVHLCYTAFDAIMEKNGLEKIKTIGDAYLAVSGMPHADINHAVNAINAAREIITFIHKRKEQGGLFDIRIGLNSGPVIAGIVGVKKFAYDIWGDTVNTAARMEQNSASGKINISGDTFELVKDKFKFEYRGKIDAKNKGVVDMYFVESETKA